MAQSQNHIVASDVYYIKLGKRGIWEEECIKKNQTLRLRYKEISHDDCKNGNWDTVYKSLLLLRKNQGAATSDLNQIRKFYEADESVLWITFYNNKMWWCFSRPDIKLLADGSRIRPVLGKWSDRDVNSQNELIVENLSGDLLKTQAFRGTICKMKPDAILQKINGIELPDIEATKDAIKELEKRIIALIQRLRWKDFEILIDLIFRQAGWQRTSPIGGTQKTYDLELVAPVTQERCLVQIKSMSDQVEFNEYCELFEKMEGYHKFFYVVNSHEGSLKQISVESQVKLLFIEDVAGLVVRAGLTEWLVAKVS
jgi:hypothetical protein